jgi:hypothetical protein
MALTNTYRNKIVNNLTAREYGLFNANRGGSVYIGLSSTPPQPDGSGVTEPNGNGYGRTLIGTNEQTSTYMFPAASDGQAANSKIIYFPEATGTWGAQLTHFVLFNNETSTQASAVLAYAKLTHDGEDAPISVTAANTVVLFRAGELVIKYVDAVTESDPEVTT